MLIFCQVKELSDRVTALTEALEYQKETAAATIEAQNDVIDNLKKDFEAKIVRNMHSE